LAGYPHPEIEQSLRGELRELGVQGEASSEPVDLEGCRLLKEAVQVHGEAPV